MKKITSIIISLVIVIGIVGGIAYLFKSTSVEHMFSAKNDDTLYVETELAHKTHYYYNSLNDEHQKRAYREIYKAVNAFEKNCKAPIPASDINKIFTAVCYDNYEFFWVSNEFSYIDYNDYVEIIFKYNNTKEEADKITAELEVKVNEILNGASQFSTDYEKELYFHDYICNNSVYDESTLETVGSTAYNLFLNGTAICEGYARAMQMLLERAGIPNYLIVGEGTSDGKTESHMWNIVNIDGQNYHLDVTWDDADAYEEPSYLYFNVTDLQISTDHSKLEPAVNDCVSSEANYFRRTGTYIKSFNSYNSLVNTVSPIVKDGSLYVELVFDTQDDYSRALKALEDDNGFFTFVDRVAKNSGANIQTDNINYINDDARRYICIIFIDKNS